MTDPADELALTIRVAGASVLATLTRTFGSLQLAEDAVAADLFGCRRVHSYRPSFLRTFSYWCLMSSPQFISFFCTFAGSFFTSFLIFLRGGREVTGATLTRFFGFHVAVLPGLATLLLAIHLLLVQRLGGDAGATRARAHLDLGSGDVGAEVGRVEALGARVLRPGDGFFVLQDPVGPPFCVTANAPDR